MTGKHSLGETYALFLMLEYFPQCHTEGNSIRPTEDYIEQVLKKKISTIQLKIQSTLNTIDLPDTNYKSLKDKIYQELRYISTFFLFLLVNNFSEFLYKHSPH